MQRAASRASSRTAACVLRAARGATSTSNSHEVELLSREDCAQIEPLTARSLLVRVPHDDDHVRILDIFIVRDAEGVLRAYQNHCPHAGGPLNLIADRFFMRNSEYLMCTRHAALFKAGDGVCIKGPCAGDALCDVPITVDHGVRTTIGALRDAVSDAFIICHADSEEAAGPMVQRPAPLVMPERRKSKSAKKSV